MTTDAYLWGALLLIAGAGLNGLITPLLRRRMERADDNARNEFTAVIRRVDENQRELATRLVEDRANANRHFESLYDSHNSLDRRVTRIEAHHQTNHPGQIT